MKNFTRRDFLQLAGLTFGTFMTREALGGEQTTGRVSQQVQKSFFLPGEDLAEDEMRITFLGTSPIPRIAQAATSIFVEVGTGDSFVFDCGTGVTAKYIAMGIPYSRMDKIFLTHLHADHTTDLMFIYCFGPSGDRKTNQHVWGPTGDSPREGTRFFCEKLREMTEWHRESFSFLSTGLKNGEDAYNLVTHELPYMEIGTAYESRGVKITHFPAIHSRNGSISYKLEWNGLKMVFSGDTRPNEYMIEQAKGVDVLIHEMVLPPEIWGSKNTGTEKGDKGFDEAVSIWKDIQDSSHTLPKALGYILSKTRPRLGVATHFQDNPDTIGPVFADVRKWYDGPFVIAGDLMVLNVSKKTIRHRTALVSNYAWPASLQTNEGQLATPKYKGPLDQINNALKQKLIPEKIYTRA